MESKVIVIVGPTCSGKTSLSLILADKLNSEIISADSRQIYKYLDIGTAKPTIDQLAKVKHHFINFLNPDENYNVSRFENEALNIIQKLLLDDVTSLVVGGSGLYVKALVDGIFDSVGVDTEYRNLLLSKRKDFGNEFLYSELKKVDMESASKMMPQNWKRIIRALEVYHLTGKPISVHHVEHKRGVDIQFKQYGLRWERSTLYKNIEKRVDDMMNLGLINETKSILKNGFDKKSNSLNTVGYKEIIAYLDNLIDLETAVQLIKRNTRRYAKRQLTWFRADDRIVWFDIKSQKDLQNITDKIIRMEGY